MSEKTLEEIRGNYENSKDNKSQKEKIEDSILKNKTHLEYILELENKIKELEEENLRTHADFQNVKKRLEKEKLNAIKHSHENFSLDMLEVLDALYLAETHIKDPKEKEGITNTIAKLEGVFKKYDITEVLYDIFDPNDHEAVQTVESKKEYSDIFDVFRKGYKIHDKILRPAMVSVSK